jgi:hypothetical protein
MGKRVFWFSLFLVSILVVVGCAPMGATREYSADSVVKMGGRIMKGKIYFAGNKWRTEYKQYGKKGISIVRTDKNVMWNLSPDQKMYLEMKIGGQELQGMTEKMPGEIERKKVGGESVNGIPCDKYKITYKLTETSPTIVCYQWLSRDKIPVKTAGADGSWSTELKNIKRGKQSSSLFEVPSGYKKFEMPKMPKGAY